MRKRLRRLRSQRAQALILFVGLFSVIMAITVIVVDFGLWFSEHRGAQKDADAAALAGVQAYLADLSDTNTAFSDGVEWAIKNGVDPAKIDPSPTSNCSDGNSCIDVGPGNCREDGTDTSMPWVEARVRHNSRALFGGIFGLVAPDIGAIARACVGSPRTVIDSSPFGVQTDLVPPDGAPETGEDCDDDRDNDHDGVINDGCGPISDCLEEDPDNLGHTRPVYGAICALRTEGGSGVSGQRGYLSLGTTCTDKSASDLAHDLRYGTSATCRVGQDVNTEEGVKSGMLAALAERLGAEGLCDELFHTGHDGYDDFDEVFSLVGADPGDPIVPSAYNVFSQNQCSVTETCKKYAEPHTFNPRVIDLVLVDQFVKEKTTKIVGFAAFYVVGCFSHDDAPSIEAAIEQDLTHMGDYMNGCESGAGGQDVIIGAFVEKLAPPSDVGDPDENLPLSIVLVK